VARALRQYASFYEVCVSLVLSDAPLAYHEALEAGAREARADKFLFLSSAVFPRARGWLGRLLMKMQRAPDAGAISPTLLYEDDSIRFAGSTELPDFKAGVLIERFRGYGRHWLEGEQPASVWTGTAECCLIRKKLFFEIGGFSRQFMDADLKTLDFGLRLRAAGSKFYWVPSVTMYALDCDTGQTSEYWSRVRRLVDLWGFQSKWSQALFGNA
jgi:GT2 family glycosyltransferase